MNSNPNFKKDVFQRKIDNHLKCGYPLPLATWKVLKDFNNDFFGFPNDIGLKPNKLKTDINGNYIDTEKYEQHCKDISSGLIVFTHK